MNLLKYIVAFFLFVNISTNLNSMALIQQAIKNPRATLMVAVGARLGFMAIGQAKEYDARTCHDAIALMDEADYKLCICLVSSLLIAGVDIGIEIVLKNKLKNRPDLVGKVKEWQKIVRSFYGGIAGGAFAKSALLYEYYLFLAHYATGCNMQDLSYRSINRAAGLEK